jgi:hypothetical protein
VPRQGMAYILPRFSYYTLLDKFIVGSTILVFLSLIESVSTSYLVSIQQREAAIRIDRNCRWTFPVAFVVVTLIVFTVRNPYLSIIEIINSNSVNY